MAFSTLSKHLTFQNNQWGDTVRQQAFFSITSHCTTGGTLICKYTTLAGVQTLLILETALTRLLNISTVSYVSPFYYFIFTPIMITPARKDSESLKLKIEK